VDAAAAEEEESFAAHAISGCFGGRVRCRPPPLLLAFMTACPQLFRKEREKKGCPRWSA
jgi:hypothetical protein